MTYWPKIIDLVSLNKADGLLASTGASTEFRCASDATTPASLSICDTDSERFLKLPGSPSDTSFKNSTSGLSLSDRNYAVASLSTLSSLVGSTDSSSGPSDASDARPHAFQDGNDRDFSLSDRAVSSPSQHGGSESSGSTVVSLVEEVGSVAARAHVLRSMSRDLQRTRDTTILPSVAMWREIPTWDSSSDHDSSLTDGSFDTASSSSRSSNDGSTSEELSCGSPLASLDDEDGDFMYHHEDDNSAMASSDSDDEGTIFDDTYDAESERDREALDIHPTPLDRDHRTKVEHLPPVRDAELLGGSDVDSTKVAIEDEDDEDTTSDNEFLAVPPPVPQIFYENGVVWGEDVDVNVAVVSASFSEDSDNDTTSIKSDDLTHSPVPASLCLAELDSSQDEPCMHSADIFEGGNDDEDAFSYPGYEAPPLSVAAPALDEGGEPLEGAFNATQTSIIVERNAESSIEDMLSMAVPFDNTEVDTLGPESGIYIDTVEICGRDVDTGERSNEGYPDPQRVAVGGAHATQLSAALLGQGRELIVMEARPSSAAGKEEVGRPHLGSCSSPEHESATVHASGSYKAAESPRGQAWSPSVSLK
jgi:hypothetical protein